MTALAASDPVADTTSDQQRGAPSPNRARLLSIIGWIPLPALLLVVAQYRRGGESVLRIHDSIEPYVAVLSRLDLGQLFSPPGERLPFMLGGIERDFLGSELHLGNLLFALAPTVWSLLIAEVLIRTLAFVGMRLLLRRLIGPNAAVVVWVTATLFSLLPFFVPAFGAIGGVPLLLWAFLRTYDERRLTRVVIAVLATFPLFSSFAFTAPHIVLIAGAILVGWLFLDRAATRPLLGGLGVLFASSVVVDWRLFASMLTGPTTQRVEMIADREWNSGLWEGVPELLTTELIHSPSGRSTLLGGVIVIGLALLCFRPASVGRRIRLAWAFSIVAIVAMYTIDRLWPVFESTVVARVMTDWGRFQLERVLWAEPAVIYVLFGLSLLAISDALERLRLRHLATVAVVLIAAIQAWTLVERHPFRATPESLTVRQFLAPITYHEFATTIADEQGDKVVSVGVHPAAAIYNGLDTADGYWNVYDRDYKHGFRELIAPALALDEGLRTYYDNWGNRVYVFQPAFGRISCCRAPSHDPYELVVEPTAFGDLGVTHVISAGPITNADEMMLREVRVVDVPEELGPMWLYRVEG